MFNFRIFRYFNFTTNKKNVELKIGLLKRFPLQNTMQWFNKRHFKI